jgi:hypothetical protein
MCQPEGTGGKMENRYLWQSAYLAAVFEINDCRIASRILAAFSAIEQRLLNPVGYVELKDLHRAHDGLEKMCVDIPGVTSAQGRRSN